MPFEGKRRAIRSLREKGDRYVRGVGLEALGRLMDKTPVDKGRARANWNVGIDRIDASENPDARRGDIGPKQREGESIIRSEFEAGTSAFITNHVPYIGPLEDGHSSQAPNGMVKVTKAEILQLIPRIAARVAAGG